ncbi:glycoside hydrolase family 43 protein [Pelagicoccus mobilis]|uniref:Glycoside hydrolase family 43 protein n=1 Tax=Pelagicoccus mobilis TaxID=415221 RepID=A0A934VRV1_9BACT|nr:glycoside hydrolase family 43 protein [Pelagicoccus mobilis]MBK1878345.1 glycoside hydrolase family 43 protein [Pelagicoccus mobilis]
MSCLKTTLLSFTLAAFTLLPLAAQTTPSFTRNASVHDPSVIKVGDRFYVYGSHGASAWTEDLMNWTQVALTVNTGNPPHFRTFQSELSELISWSNATTLWAADVYQLDDGKFYYYYNVWTNHLDYRSYMGVAVSDTVEGPYEDLGEMLRGGTGVSGFDPRIHPNTIDPTLFRDTEDELWMVYGSYSGGIYVLKMDDQTGFQLPNQGFGTRINGGNHSVMEGPFIDYNADTGYYYLFLSYGGLAAADGYNMRVFRAEHPAGPYRDPAGTDMSTAPLNASLSSINPHGLKLAGNWQFLPVEGELATSSTGYLSPGHNSIIQDPTTGKWFNFFHTRFVGRGEQHEVRIHQLFFNEDGWPVMAPHRYAGETQGSYTTAEIAGSYKIINHGKDTVGDVKTSTVIGLKEDGGLVGVSGSWEMIDEQNIRLTVDGTLFKGIVSDFWDNENRMWVKGFSAISPDGTSLWGSELAIVNRSGDLPAPELVALKDMALPMGENLDLIVASGSIHPDLILEYKVLEGPGGMGVDPGNGRLTWIPTPSQMGKVFNVHIQVYDLIEPNLSDEIQFTIYIGGGYEQAETSIEFSQASQSGLPDKHGNATGLSTRLSGTGIGYNQSDPNLTLDLGNAALLLESTQADFNGQAGVTTTSAIGVKLSDLGYTGEEDFNVTAQFGPITGLESIDQVGVYVGTSATTLTRAGIFQSANPEGLAVHTQNGNDNNATFDQSSYDLSDGLTVSISRNENQWAYTVDGVSISPQVANATFLDSASDLSVGVFAINPLNANSKTVTLKSLDITVATDQLRTTRIQQWKTSHFGDSPAPGIAGHGDDPDRDGNSNLVEYALGSNPLVPDSPPNSDIEVIANKLVWTLTQIDDPALRYEVHTSDTPRSEDSELLWESANDHNQNGPIQIETPLSTQPGDSRFLELNVYSVE